MTAPRKSINIGYGTGTPAGFSNFRPINPWGRSMPKPSRPVREDLYQCVVKDWLGAEKVVGPKMSREATERFVMAINGEVALGREKEWQSAVAVPVDRKFAS